MDQDVYDSVRDIGNAGKSGCIVSDFRNIERRVVLGIFHVTFADRGNRTNWRDYHMAIIARSRNFIRRGIFS